MQRERPGSPGPLSSYEWNLLLRVDNDRAGVGAGLEIGSGCRAVTMRVSHSRSNSVAAGIDARDGRSRSAVHLRVDAGRDVSQRGVAEVGRLADVRVIPARRLRVDRYGGGPVIGAVARRNRLGRRVVANEAAEDEPVEARLPFSVRGDRHAGRRQLAAGDDEVDSLMRM